jgi:hypothetical protein
MGDGARGGGINTSYIGFVTLSQSTVSGNCTAGDEAHGGGIYAKNRVTLTQSTVSGNSTTGDEAHGGGIYTRYGEATLTQSTVTENHTLDANSMGGGVFHRNTNNNHPFSISGSIVAGNTAGGGGADLVPDPNSTLTVNYSLIGVADGLAVIGDVGNLTGTAVSPLAPQLDPLADNGGPTETHALLPGSPALNAGDPNFDPHAFDPPLLSDQRGLPLMRVFGGRIDIGAFEDQPTPVGPALPGDYNLDGRVNAADYIAWRNTEGDTVTAFSGADGNGDGQVADADYELWRMNFGNTLPPPAATNGSGGSESRGVEEPERGRIEASESHRVAAPPSRTATNSGSRPSDPQPSTFPADDGLLLLLALDRAERSSRQRPSIFDDPGNDRDRPAGWGDPHLVDASIEAASWQW